MNEAPTRERSTRINEAIEELRAMIFERYPTATFNTTRGDDPAAMYLTTTVDSDDPDEVLDLVIDRLLELQVDEELPVYVLPVRPWERVAQSLESRRTAQSLRASGAVANP